MPVCVALNCTHRNFKGCGYSFHRFPHRDPEQLEKWVENVRREDWAPSSKSCLCSKHFAEECFDRTGQTIRLRKGAIPTIFSYTKSLNKLSAHRKKLKPLLKVKIAHPKHRFLSREDQHLGKHTQHFTRGTLKRIKKEHGDVQGQSDASLNDIHTEESEVPNKHSFLSSIGLGNQTARVENGKDKDAPLEQCDDTLTDSKDEPNTSDRRTTYSWKPSREERIRALDHPYAMMTAPLAVKRRLDVVTAQLRSTQKKLKTEQQRSRRLQARITKLQSIIEVMCGGSVVVTNCSDVLDAAFSKIPQKVLDEFIDTD